MSRYEQKLIGLDKPTYERLLSKKNRSSFNEYVNIMLNYFDATKIDPKSCQESPQISYLKQIERVIKLAQAIEKKSMSREQDISDKLDYLINIFTQVEALRNKEISLDDLEKEGITVGMLNDVIHKDNTTQEENEAYRQHQSLENQVNGVLRNLYRVKKSSFQIEGSKNLYTKDRLMFNTLVKMYDECDKYLPEFVSGLPDIIQSYLFDKDSINEEKLLKGDKFELAEIEYVIKQLLEYAEKENIKLEKFD